MNPTIDKIIAVVAILCLVFFMSIILVYVERWNLALVTAVGLAMAAYDFWRELFRRRNGD